MQIIRDEILKAALQLSDVDRLLIANRLLATLPDDAIGLTDDDPGFDDELERRSGDWKNAVPWEQLKHESPPAP